MNKREYRVDAKIIKQLSQYLMFHGIKEFSLSFQSSKNEVTFIIESELITPEISEYMKDKISRKREIEVEVYGWELLGDTDSQNELDILGALIDEISIRKENNKTTVIMKRFYHYNEK
ncbi:MAG: hypothetical protein ACLFPM_02985 [Candidatus Izemoplasmatales bacterium]